MSYKIIESKKYIAIVGIAIVSTTALFVLSATMAKQISEKNKIEDDLRMVIKMHNDKNHALKECEDNIIDGTCLTKIPTYQEMPR